MREQFIALLDSGIGGISVLNELVKNFPNESFLYFGDNNNSPYGNKNVYQLLSLTLKNIDIIKSYPVKAIVVACNTLSVNIINNIIEYSSIPVFPIFPPVENCVMSGQRTLLLATNMTAKNYTPNSRVDIVGMSNLVFDIEKNMFDLQKVSIKNNLINGSSGVFVNKKNYYQTVILGCTHFNFVKNQILDHFQPQKLIDGTTFVIFWLKKFLQSTKSLYNYRRFKVLFIGDNARFNEQFFIKSGQSC